VNPFNSPVLYTILRVSVAVIVSFFFFVLVAMLHTMMGIGGKQEQKKNAPKAVMMEMIRKPPEPPKKQQEQLKRIQGADKSAKAFGDQTTMRFIPDLGLDASGGGEGDVVVQTRDLQAEIFEEGQTDEKAVPLNLSPIQYPERAREMHIEGKFIVIFVVGFDGRVKSIDVKQSPSPIITSEARRTIMTWRFKPARNKGVPVNVRMKQEINFELKLQ
jgi:TonB family protein